MEGSNEYVAWWVEEDKLHVSSMVDDLLAAAPENIIPRTGLGALDWAGSPVPGLCCWAKSPSRITRTCVEPCHRTYDRSARFYTAGLEEGPWVAKAALQYVSEHPGLRVDLSGGWNADGIHDVCAGLAGVDPGVDAQERVFLDVGADFGLSSRGVRAVAHRINSTTVRMDGFSLYWDGRNNRLGYDASLAGVLNKRRKTAGLAKPRYAKTSSWSATAGPIFARAVAGAAGAAFSIRGEHSLKVARPGELGDALHGVGPAVWRKLRDVLLELEKVDWRAELDNYLMRPVRSRSYRGCFDCTLSLHSVCRLLEAKGVHVPRSVRGRAAAVRKRMEKEAKAAGLEMGVCRGGRTSRITNGREVFSLQLQKEDEL